MTDKSPTLEELETIVDDSDVGIHEMLREEFAQPEEEPENDAEGEVDQDEDPDPEVDQDEDPDPEVDQDEDSEEDGEEDKQTEEVEPPADWTAEEHERFRKLDTDSQKWVLDRVNSAREAEGKATETAKKYQDIEDAIKDHRDQWARDGMSEGVALKQLVALSDYAAKKPEEFITWFAAQRGINIGDKTAPPEQDQGLSNDQLKDPAIRALVQRHEALERKLSELYGHTEKITGPLTQRDREEAAAQQQRNIQTIEEFRTATDESGKPKHPHFSQVREMMGVLLEAGKANDLEDAYDRACRADPDVWAKIELSRKAKETQEAAKQSRGKAAAARKAGSSVSGSPGARSEPATTGDLREDLRALMAEKGLV